MIGTAKYYLALVWTSWLGLTIYFVGGFDTLFRALLIMMALDYVTGVAKGFKNKNANSNRAYKGLRKKLIILVIIVAATQMDMILQGMGTVSYTHLTLPTKLEV